MDTINPNRSMKFSKQQELWCEEGTMENLIQFCCCCFVSWGFFFLILFIWLCRVFIVARRIFTAACRIFVAARVIFQLWQAGCSVVARGIQFPDQGSNPGPLHRELGVLATGPPGKSPDTVYQNFFEYRTWCHSLNSISQGHGQTKS